MSEHWKPVVGYDGYYEVSNLGRVRSVDRTIETKRGPRRQPGRLLVPTPKGTGHLGVTLSRGGVAASLLIHRLVCEAFHGPPPMPDSWALHWDDDPTNNRADNLRWGTLPENAKDSVRNGRHYFASKTHCKRGHPLIPGNLLSTTDGSRKCKQCATLYRRQALPAGDPRHGTMNGYNNLGCRCEACRGARSARRERAALTEGKAD